MKSLEQQEACPHNRTVEVFAYIYKCSDCGAVLDGADNDALIERQQLADKNKRSVERRARRQEYFKNKNRRK